MSFSPATRPILDSRFRHTRVSHVCAFGGYARSGRRVDLHPHPGWGRTRVNLLTGHGRFQLDLALVAADLLDSHLDRVADPVRAPAAAADQGGAERVQLEVVACKPPRRHEALEDVLEQREQ